MSFVLKSTLPRLPRENYRGHAVVFWTHTMEKRATGWLGDAFHICFREVLLHACARYALVCPVYVLMPDHWHLVLMGLDADSDQHSATKFLRKNLAAHMREVHLQDRAHDSVLREKERRRNAFMIACRYVQENPARAGLVRDWREWDYVGAMAPGYPDFDPRTEEFWDDFWKIYNRLIASTDEFPALPSRATESK